MKEDTLLNLLLSQNQINQKEAIGLILAGRVLVNDTIITKINKKINIDNKIRIKNLKKYVSRGAYKLKEAIENFKIDITNLVCIDIGSSTGGFTQVLLEKKAKKIYAIDCGNNQLDYSLRTNSCVISIENQRIQDISRHDFLESQIDFAVMDVSFASSIPIIKYVFYNLDITKMVVLIKPQFEYERLVNKLKLKTNFNGVVGDSQIREQIINYLKYEIDNLGLQLYQDMESPITGAKGNIEYLFFIGKNQNA